MEDNQIIELFMSRSENAINETMSMYGKYCYAIAFSLLANSEDASECVNDTFLAAWNSIPPNHPSNLSLYLGRITRRISIDRLRRTHAIKRGGSELTLALEELDECIHTSENIEHTLEVKELSVAINDFLSTLSQTERDVFVCRYWFLASVKTISEKFKFSQSKTKAILYRTRTKLKAFLIKEGLI